LLILPLWLGIYILIFLYLIDNVLNMKNDNLMFFFCTNFENRLLQNQILIINLKKGG